MTTLFRPVPVIDQPCRGDTFECLAYGCNFLYVGTSAATVLSFTVAASNRTDEELQNSGCPQRSVQLLPGSGKKIEELVCPEGSNARIFAVCDGGIHILPGSLANAGTVLAKNALCFALQTDPAVFHATTEQFRGYDVEHGHICVGSKRKLHLFRPVSPPGQGGAGGELHLDSDDIANLKYELYQEIPLAAGSSSARNQADPKERTGPQLCRWHKSSIIVGFKREYVLVNQDDGTVRDIFQLDGKSIPRVLVLPHDEVLLLHQDKVGLFFNVHTGQPSTKHTVEFKDTLLHLNTKTPQYILGTSRTGIEVFSVRDQSCKQTLLYLQEHGFSDNNFGQNLTCVSDGNKRLFLGASGASKNQVFCLSEIPLRTQLAKLLEEERRQDALDLLTAHLAGSDTHADPAKRHLELQNFHEKAGWVFFAKLKFELAFHHFALSAVPVPHLLRFFATGLLPAEWFTELEAEAWEIARRLRRRALNDAPVVFLTESPFYYCDENAEDEEEHAGMQKNANQPLDLKPFIEQKLRDGALRSKDADDEDKLQPVGPGTTTGPVPPSVDVLMQQAQQHMARFLLTVRGAQTWMQQSLSERKRADMVLLRLSTGSPARNLVSQENFSCVAGDFPELFLKEHRDLYALLLKKENRLEEALSIYTDLFNREPKNQDFVHEIRSILSKLLIHHSTASVANTQQALLGGSLGYLQAKPSQIRELILSHLAKLPRTAVADLFTTTPLASYQAVVAPLEVFRLTLLNTTTSDLAPADLVEQVGKEERSFKAPRLQQAQRFLEHLISQENVQDRDLSTALAVLYAHRQSSEGQHQLPQQQGSSTSALSAMTRAASSTSSLHGRGQLAQFLDQASTIVNIDRILLTLNNDPTNTFDWERCLLFRKQGRHAEALKILCGGRLGGLQQAELYCLGAVGLTSDAENIRSSSGNNSTSSAIETRDLVLSNSNTSSSEILQSFEKQPRSITTQLLPQASAELQFDTGKRLNEVLSREAKTSRASDSVFQICFEVLLESENKVPFPKILAFCNRYYEFLDAERVIDQLPDEVPVNLLEEFLRKSVLQMMHTQRQQQVEEKLSAAAYQKTYRDWYQTRQVCVHLTSERCCPICHRRVGDKAFAASYNDLKVYHIHCLQGKKSLD
ncbi:unnamed protein product [Amoebophrya sp. A120]|nr:unnamed protein product [Amoebophrya sp. A120]|eukprot:GSA120T00024026001.1